MSQDRDLPRVLTVSYVLENIPAADQGASERRDCVSNEQIQRFLQDNGIVLGGDDEDGGGNEPDADAAEAAFVALGDHPEFWAVHYPIHPNSKRVKKWLWVHSRYRSQADALLTSLNDLEASTKPPRRSSAQQQRSATRRLLAQFRKFVGKMESHSEFENTQLFKFFLDEKIGANWNDDEHSTAAPNVSDALSGLMEQHYDAAKSVTEIEKCLDKMSAADASDGSSVDVDALMTELKRDMTKYVDDLKSHLQEEESIVVALWLQLTPQQYKKYRTYLSWKYAMMY